MKPKLNKEVHVRLSEEDLERLKRLAELNHRSVGNQLRAALHECLKQAELHGKCQVKPTPLFAAGENASGEPSSSGGEFGVSA